MFHIKEAAVHRIPSGRHVMHINISVPACLNLFRRHKKLLIQFLIQLVKNQTPFGGYQRRIRVGVFLVAHIHDRLALFIYIVQHTDKILFIIPIIPITLGYDGLHLFQRALHNIVHHRNGDCIRFHFFHFGNHILTDVPFLLVRKPGQRTVCGFPHRINDLLHMKCFPAAVLFNDPCGPAGLKLFTVICRICLFLRCRIHRSSSLRSADCFPSETPSLFSAALPAPVSAAYMRKMTS